MKNIVLGVVLTGAGILMLIIILTISGRMTRSKEETTALETAVEAAVENAMEQDNYSIDDNQEFIADFLEALLIQVENDSEIEVRVAGIDYEKGLLSVNVIQHFLNPNGSASEISYATTVVMEQNGKEDFCKIIYQDYDGTLIKEYRIAKNDSIITPSKNPEREGFTFIGWRDSNGTMVTDFGKAKEDVVYVAVYQK